ncbi:hypothetical protein J1605_004868 [Eschrichtius robustus]|uniref:ADF-H domain-containing protein n=1 Tax=Eschrichtius robustus TaxID=9764 RepID=A0AB34HCY0_ESCRO|nr:hypothetical protein J1605_004868 [Eschrichtius robustus]
MSRERAVSSRGRTAPAPRAAPPLAGRTQLRRGAREARPARPPQGSKAAVAAPRQAGRAPALFLPRRLPYLSGERRRAASPPPATPARPPLRRRRRRRRGSKGRVGRERAGRGASRKPAGQVGEERKEPRNSRAAREDGARRAGRGLRAAGAARSRDPPPPGHERGPPAGHGVRARPGPWGSCRSASCTASALPGACLLPEVSTCVTVKGSWSLRIDVSQGDSPLTNGSVTAVASSTPTLGTERLSDGGYEFVAQKRCAFLSAPSQEICDINVSFTDGVTLIPWLRNVVSSVAVSGVIKVFNDMKVRKSSSPEDVKKRKKAVLFCLSEDTKNLILEEGEGMLVGDVGQTADDPYPCQGEQEGGLGLESAPLKSKMIYASSKDAIEQKLMGIKHELEANCYEDVKDHCTLAEKLGVSLFISLEGKPQTCSRGLQAAPFLPDQRGWGESQQGVGNPFTQVAKQPPHLLDHPPPSIPEGSGLPKLLLIFFLG